MSERKVIFQMIWSGDTALCQGWHEEFEDIDTLNAYKATLDTNEVKYVKVLVGYVLEETEIKNNELVN